ncbi:MAG: type II secretion system protein M [Gammaproteobacteria bacterium]|nr:type II secretion system protein M [Gammaproteobacteria bacterium]
MKQWFLGLNERERLMVVIAACLVAYAVVHFAVLAPLWGGSARLAAEIPERQALLAELKAAEVEIGGQRRGSQRTQPIEGAGQSLVVIIDRTSREAGLGASLRRNQPTPDQGLRVGFEGAPFEALVPWLAQLQRRYGIGVESASFDTAGTPGLVNATLVLERRP